LKRNGALDPHVTVLDPTPAMMEEGKAKAYDQNNFTRIDWQQGMAEDLPFEDNTFDAYTISFGLRNVSNREKALQEALRVLKPGAPFFCMEFSKIQGPLGPLYRLYAMKGIPLLGQFIAADKEAYRYLSESIERFWDPETFLEKLKETGFSHGRFERLSQGLVAIHQGWKE
jgi:demethylmenaquinone methyltransferase/2-methoxy-6-polyprenyl-1,4-benzoquinol methylase